MAKQYDGSINIDSKIDEKGFNRGIRDIEGSMREAGGSLTKGINLKGFAGKAKSIGRTLKTVFGTVANVIAIGLIVGIGIVLTLVRALIGLLSAVAAMVVAGATAFVGFTNIMYKGMSQSSYLYSQFRQMNSLFLDLKSTILAAFAPLWLAVQPTVIRIVNWLIQMFNILSQVLATLFGQSTYMKYVAGSAQQAANASGALKKNTEDAEKAAKGALAAFDEINVLQQEEPEIEAPTAGGVSAGQLGEFEEVPVDSEIAKKVEEIRTAVEEAWAAVVKWWEDTKQRARDAWDDVVTLWGTIQEWWRINVSEPLKTSMSGAWEAVKASFADVWSTITSKWTEFKGWFKVHVTDPLFTNFDQTWAKIKVGAYLAWLNVKAKWIQAKQWFTDKVIDPIKNAFSTAWEKIKESFNTAWEKMPDTVKGAINKIIDFLNQMIGKVENAINSLISGLNSLGEIFPGWTSISPVAIPRIPQLAEGGVIPPNASFLAMLGDQKHGTNIEAPEDLIRQIVREETADQAVTINFAGSLSGLVQVLKPYIDKENTRVGSSLVKGAIT